MNEETTKAEKATKTVESIHPDLDKVRRALRVPKAKENKFGGYNYRSCEDILNALKPHLFEFGLFLAIQDEMAEFGGRIYVKSTATVCDKDGGNVIAVGFAREAENKKGMSEDQITGSASSYARKYALNAMFLIDDSVEPDSQEEDTITANEAEEIKADLEATDSDIAGFLKWGGCESVEQFPARLLNQARQKIAAKKGGAK